MDHLMVYRGVKILYSVRNMCLLSVFCILATKVFDVFCSISWECSFSNLGTPKVAVRLQLLSPQEGLNQNEKKTFVWILLCFVFLSFRIFMVILEPLVIKVCGAWQVMCPYNYAENVLERFWSYIPHPQKKVPRCAHRHVDGKRSGTCNSYALSNWILWKLFRPGVSQKKVLVCKEKLKKKENVSNVMWNSIIWLTADSVM